MLNSGKKIFRKKIYERNKKTYPPPPSKLNGWSLSIPDCSINENNITETLLKVVFNSYPHLKNLFYITFLEKEGFF